ncbi:MAG: HTH-type transcriptional activator CmpR [Desulfovibrio sp.]
MRINLNQLHVFYLAGRHKNMAEAAKRLYVSAPAVTMQIKKLEQWLGFPVFQRGHGELQFTERGRALYDAVKPLFFDLSGLERYIQDLVQTEEVELKLGTHHLPGNYFIPDLIAYVHAKYPKLKVRMELGTQDRLLEELAQQKLDLALMIGDLPPDVKCKTLHLFDEELVLVTAADSELAKLESVQAKDLASIPLILQQKGAGARRAVLDFLSAHGVPPNIRLENLSSDVIKQFLPKMEAAALIGRFIVQKELDDGVFHEIRLEVDKPPVSRFYLAYMDSQYIPLKVRYFLSGVAGFKPHFRTFAE